MNVAWRLADFAGQIIEQALLFYWTLEDQKVTRSDLSLWRRAVILHLLISRASMRAQLRIVRPVNLAILGLFGESKDDATKIVDMLHGSAISGGDAAFEILTKWARGEASWPETWAEYREILSGERLPDHIKNMANELDGLSVPR